MRSRWLWAAVGLAAALRLPTLGQQSLWYDEAATVVVVKGSFGHMWHLIPDMEGNPPLYYVLAWIWAHVFGHGELGLRSLSALLGIALIPVCWALGRELGGTRAAAAGSALFAASSPFLVWFSQEARAYSLMVLLVSLALLSLLREQPWRWALWSSLALATHYFAALLVGPMALLLLHRRRRAALPGLAAIGGCAAALAPLAIHQHDHARKSIVGSFGTRALQLPKQLLVGYHAPLDRPLAALIALIVLLGIARAAAASRTHARSLLLLCGGSLALVAMLALAGLDYLDSRNMIFLLAALAALIGGGLGGRPELGVLCLLGVAVVLIVDTHASAQRDDWRGALRAALGDGRAGPHALVVTPGQGYLPVLVYRPAAREFLSGSRPVREIDVIGMASRATGDSPAPPPPRPAPAGFRADRPIRTPLYTVQRYRSDAARPLSQSAVAAAHLGAGFPVLFTLP